MNKLEQIDRITPTCRPEGRPRGYQQWRSLLFMHWPVSQAALREIVPSELELDLYEGEAYLGVVPFAMQGVRPRWWHPSWAFQFLELNVRTYVVCNGQPGIFFLSLEAESRLAVWAARKFWGLPYFHARMKMSNEEGNEMAFESSRSSSQAVHRVRYRIDEELGDSQPESLEFFFLERYLLFCEYGGRIFSGQVSHIPYPAQKARILEIEDTVIGSHGLEVSSPMPSFSHYAKGVDVDVFSLKPIA